MTKNNVRIAIRDSTDSHNVAFFDNEAGIKYKSANLQRFLAGSASILTLKYNSKDIDSIRSGCKLAFRYKARDYWLNIMKFEKQGFEVEITACSLHLEMNNEERGAHKPDKAMSFAEYLAYYDPEHSVTLGTNQVSDKKIKLEWTGTDTILARLFSIANSFDAELEFVTELNDDYSLKRHVLNVYKKGNLGSNKTSSPVRVGKELKVINYSDSIEDLRTAVRATGKDGLTIDGLNKKIYDDNKQLLYYSSGNTVYAPQSRDRFPSVGQASNDNWLVKDLGETEYETKEGLWGYMYGEIQKICLPKIEYKVTGAIDSDVGDTQTLIDDVHYEPPLYLKARVSELTDDILQGKVIDSTFINFERQYSQIADSLLKQVEALAEDAAPYIVRLSTDNGYNFKNGQGTSTITAKLEKYSKIVNTSWKWLINNSVVSENASVTINASQVVGTLNVVAVASVGGNEVAREYITFTNSDDGVGIKSITRYYTTNDQADGVTAGGQNWSTKPTTVTADNNYMWSYDVITYTNDTSLVTEPAVIGARGDDGLDADTIGITEALDKAKQELTALSANIEKVRDDSLAAVNEAKQQLTAVANDLSTAKQDLQTQASQLQAQANAQSELTKRVSSVEETANGTKATVSELNKTVDSNTKNITSVTARTKVVEDDLLNTKTTLSQVQTTANSANQKTATLESGLNGLTAKFNSLSFGGVNLFKGSRDFSGTDWVNNNSGVYAEDYQGIKIFKTGSAWNGRSQYFEVKAGEEYVFSAYVKSSAETDYVGFYLANPSKQPTAAGLVSFGSVSNQDSIYFELTDKYKRIAIKIKITKDGWIMPRLERSNANAYLFFGGYKLERGNIPTDYSPNESDLEQKVAEYKQNADQNYASLQTTVQALDGTVKQNKSEFDQTASQIKSNISAVEGKIPKSVGGRNLIIKSQIQNGYIDANGNLATATSQFTTGFIDGTNNKQFTITAPKFAVGNLEWLRLARYDASKNFLGRELFAYTKDAKTVKVINLADNVAYFKVSFDGAYGEPFKIERGSLTTDWSPAPEDAIEEISSLSSQIQQTADGMTLLATKTEVNAAKSDLQSGITTATSKADNAQSTANSNAQKISTHTTQISALNTGLSAKVSQSDFNTLSGRVTNAENNITAKANELSSQISSVSKRIPSEIGAVNLIKQSTAQKGLRLAMDAGTFSDSKHMLTDWIKVEPSTIYTLTTYEDVSESDMWYSMAWYSTNSTDYSGWISRPTGAATAADLRGGKQYQAPANAKYAKVSYPINYPKVKLERGSLATDYSPNPEDYDAALTQAKSEIKQTTDAIKASVSSLDNSTVKSATLNLDNNGFVTKVGKTVNGNTLATMIAQNESDVQIIAKKMKVSGDMIVNGAITAEKLNINSLSALSAKLGDVTSGSITNAFSSGKRSGSIKIKDNVEITSTDTSNLLPEKAKENLVLSTGSLAMNASTSSDKATHSMLIMPETIKYTKNNYDTTRGGTNGWSLTHNGYYSMLQVDMVWQNVRLNNTSNLPYGIKANYVRIGNLVTISVNRQITNVAVVIENNLASETIPTGFRPISQAHLTLTGNTGSTIDATCICHLNPDGTIRFTNNKTGNRVWTGTVTYTCVEPMPYVKDLNNGSTI